MKYFEADGGPLWNPLYQDRIILFLPHCKRPLGAWSMFTVSATLLSSEYTKNF